MKRILAATALAALLLTALPYAEAAPTADAPWSGYRLSTTTTAASGWIGARKASDQAVYRIDPSRPRATSTGFRSGAWQSTVTGTGPRRVTAVDTARAAWIVSKYGDYRYALQNAAVEVALDHLLHGGRWALSGTATRQRLAQTSQAAAITRFATTMLDDSARLAGPYGIDVVASGAPAGGSVTVTVRVTATRTTTGIASLPVTATYDATTVAGLRTGPDGSVSTQVPAGSAGPHTLTVAVDRLPESRLLVRTPTTTGASRIVVAGAKSRRTTTRTVAVQAGPAVTSTSTSAEISTSQSPSGRFTVLGSYPGTRSAAVGLFGPFDSAGAAVCAPARLARTASVAVTGDGSYPYPALSVPRYGYYVWGVSLPADQYDAAAAACSGTVLARVQPDLSVTSPGTRFRTGAYVHGLLELAGLPADYSASATLRLYGPFTSAGSVSCSATRLKATQEVPLTHDGTTEGPEVRVTNLGYYLWSAELPASEFSLPAATGCTAPGAVFQVTW